MSTSTMTSSEFNRDSGAAKRAAANGPVIITDRGTPSHVLLTWEAFEKLKGREKTIAEALAMPGMEDIEFEPERFEGKPRAATFD